MDTEEDPEILLTEREFGGYKERHVESPETPLAEPAIPSFLESEYESQEMKKLLALHQGDDTIPAGLADVSYNPAQVFPDWILNNPNWKNAPKRIENSNEISEILKIPVSKRSPEQVSTLIHWLMSVWGIANTMGFKRCGSMFKEFKYHVYEPNENIIVEGERGLVFYIIISGTTTVHKAGIGIVGQLSKGKSFGEIALTQGKDLRTATVTAATRVEVLSLHKHDYDYFVRDIQELEKRENFTLLSTCQLFKSWPKGKIEKMCNTCVRKTFEAGSYIFRQGDPPEDLYVVVEGIVNIFKELVIICKNRWPVAIDQWKERVRRVTKPIMLKSLQRGDYFGEVAILKNLPRTTSAIAQNHTVLISLNKEEFLHLVNYGSTSVRLHDEEALLNSAIQKYIGDEEVMDTINHIKGGPQSQAFVGQVKAGKADIEKKAGTDSEAGTPVAVGKSPKPLPAGKTPKSVRSAQGHVYTFQEQASFENEFLKITRDSAVAEKIRLAAIAAKKERKADRVELSSAFQRPKSRAQSRGEQASSNSPPSSPSPKARSKREEKLGVFKSKLEAVRRGSIQFSGASVQGKGRSSQISMYTNKRNSLQGLDNENPDFVFDPKKIVLRRNSAINLGMVYENLYQKLQAETQQNLDTAVGAVRGLRASMASIPQIPQLAALNAESDVANKVPFSSATAGGESPNSSRIRLPSRKETIRKSAGSMTSLTNLTIQTGQEEGVETGFIASDRRASTSPVNRRASKATPDLMKFLNKPILTYREAMES